MVSVGVPELAAGHGQAFDEFGGAGLAADDDQAHLVQALLRPQGEQGGDGGDRGDAALDQPGAQVGAGLDQGAGGGDQAGAMAPGQPHLLTGGVEGHREAGQDAVAGAQRMLAQEDPGLGVDEGGGAAVGDGHTLGAPGGTGGEDDPRVVVGIGPGGTATGPGAGTGEQTAFGTQDGTDLGVLPDHLGAFVGIVGVHRHVGGAAAQHGQDTDVQVGGAGRDTDPDPVTGTDAVAGQDTGEGVDLLQEGAVVQDGVAGVERGCVGVRVRGGGDDVEQAARVGGLGHRPARGEPGMGAVQRAWAGRVVAYVHGGGFLGSVFLGGAYRLLRAVTALSPGGTRPLTMTPLGVGWMQRRCGQRKFSSSMP